jgi:hypothetical protein
MGRLCIAVGMSYEVREGTRGVTLVISELTSLTHRDLHHGTCQ